jgi:3D (Asp-Asp-Asp) domain-containing protein
MAAMVTFCLIKTDVLFVSTEAEAVVKEHVAEKTIEFVEVLKTNNIYIAYNEAAVGQNAKYLGEYKLSAYCACAKCCDVEDGITATGTIATANRTIAVDPKKIPYGSRLLINGQEYVAEDCGGAIKGNRIDIYFDTHEEALQFGIQYADVYKLS